MAGTEVFSLSLFPSLRGPELLASLLHSLHFLRRINFYTHEAMKKGLLVFKDGYKEGLVW